MHLSFFEVRTTVRFVVVFLRQKADRDALNKTGFDAMPSLVRSIFYDSWFVNLGNLGLEGKPPWGRFAKLNGAYWLIVLVMDE